MRHIIVSLFISLIFASFGKSASPKFPEISGFKLEVNEKTYTPDNLWDLINGAADAYLENDFVELFLAEYTSQPNVSVRVEVYEHKNLNGAFGMYSTERMPDYSFMPIGVQGYQAKGILNFLLGKYYIKLQGDDGMALELIAEELVSFLNQPKSFPRELNFLPDARLPYSDGYANHNYLGHSFLHHFFFASYNISNEIQVFISVKESIEEAQKVVKSFLDATGTKYKSVDDGIYKLNDPYSGTIFLKLDGRYIYGTVKCEKKKEAYFMIDAVSKKIS